MVYLTSHIGVCLVAGCEFALLLTWARLRKKQGKTQHLHIVWLPVSMLPALGDRFWHMVFGVLHRRANANTRCLVAHEEQGVITLYPTW